MLGFAWSYASAHDGELPNAVTDDGPDATYAVAAEKKKTAERPFMSLDTRFQLGEILSKLTESA
jgi:hypothetical protein